MNILFIASVYTLLCISLVDRFVLLVHDATEFNNGNDNGLLFLSIIMMANIAHAKMLNSEMPALTYWLIIFTLVL